jgi:hypothetical protein
MASVKASKDEIEAVRAATDGLRGVVDLDSKWALNAPLSDTARADVYRRLATKLDIIDMCEQWIKFAIWGETQKNAPMPLPALNHRAIITMTLNALEV